MSELRFQSLNSLASLYKILYGWVKVKCVWAKVPGMVPARTMRAQVSLILSLLVGLKAQIGQLFGAFLGGDVEGAKTTTAAVTGAVLQVGKAIMVAVIMLIVLGELYATDIVANPTNPNAFINMTETFAQYGTTAFTMIGLGLIAAGASAALAYFGMFGDKSR